MPHPDKIHNQNNQQAIANDTRWKKQIILHTRAFAFAHPKKYHSTQDFIPSFLEYKSEWKTSSKTTPKRRKQRKPPKKSGVT